MRGSDVILGAAALALSAYACAGRNGVDSAAAVQDHLDGGAPAPSPVAEAGADAGGDASDASAISSVRSCAGSRGAGAGRDCGGSASDDGEIGAEDCCETLLVPGGTFRQFDDERYPATVSSFLLDRFEVTVGRFRTWVDATGGDLRAHAPPAGAGAHPFIAGSGWRDEWNALLPSTAEEVDHMLGPEACQVGADVADYGALTWWTPALASALERLAGGDPALAQTNAKTVLDRKPLNCVPWEVLFAFCIWDGGRLPTNAEWGYAAAGGDEQRQFPWGDMRPDEVARIGEHENLSLAPRFGPGAPLVVASLWNESSGPNTFPTQYAYTWGSGDATPHQNAAHMAAVGRRSAGRGKWGHEDLAGGVYEWMLDEGPIHPGSCTDCANVRWPAPSMRDPDIPVPFPLPDFEDRWFAGGARAIRGGAWDNALGLSNRQTDDEIKTYTSYPVRRTYRSLGGRCARDLR
jgi:formylglycine-generating enzyme required for sulfatase activity